MMEGIQNVKPKLFLLSPKQIQEVHEHSLRVLSSVGVRVDSNRARKLLVHAMGEKQADTEIVRIPLELVEWAIKKAPTSIDVYDRSRTFISVLHG
jgi:trimethylamine--corrinoid protein Co-methyltransferase